MIKYIEKNASDCLNKFVLLMTMLIAFYQSAYSQIQPNILWIVTEDISPTLSMYGDSTAKTPNLDALAAHSIIYQNAFSVVGVCGPSRSSIITGMYPTSIGTMHMRTANDISSHGKREYDVKTGRKDINGNEIIEYSTVLPEKIKCFTEYLRAAGYFCTNNQKTDYQFAAPLSAWDQNNNKAHWKNRPPNKPFFSVININETHESMLWNNKEKLTVDPEKVVIPPYLVDSKIQRNDLARHYSNIEIMDAKIGSIIKELKEDGLYDNTIIFFYSDHGGPMIRQKRETNDRGMKIPFMVKPLNSHNSKFDSRLISLVDLPPTLLSICSIKIPKYMDGIAFMASKSAKPRKYVFGSGDRFDEFTDRTRAIRTDSFLYVRNYFPNLPSYKDLAYRKNIPSMNELLQLHKKNKLNPMQDAWFNPKNAEEIYAVYADPYNVNNLATNKNYTKKLKELSKLFDAHLSKYKDLAQLGEKDMVLKMWPNNIQPQTSRTVLKYKNGIVSASCQSPGASISYILSDEPVTKLDRDQNWQLYTKPIKATKGKYITFVSERIGYKTSDLASIRFADFNSLR